MSAEALALVESVFGPCEDVSDTPEAQRWVQEFKEAELRATKARAQARRNRRYRVSESDNVERLVKASEALYEWAEKKMPDRLDKAGWVELREALDAIIDEGMANLSDPLEPQTQTRVDARPSARAAARAALPTSGSQRRRVLDLLMAQPATDEDIAKALDMNPSSVRPRRGELVEGGWIHESSLQATTDAGLAAIVWEPTVAGRRAWQENRSLA